jgi:hypothetical protein
MEDLAQAFDAKKINVYGLTYNRIEASNSDPVGDDEPFWDDVGDVSR